MGIEENSMINIHIGGAYGDKKTTLVRFAENLTFSDRSLPSSRNVKSDSPMSRWEMNVGWR